MAPRVSGGAGSTPALPHVLLLAVLLVLAALGLGQGLALYRFEYLVFGAAAAALFGLVFIRTDFGLYVLIFSMLLSPEFILGGSGALAERREFVLRIEDFILAIIALAWLAKTAVNKELGLVARTPLNRPIVVYIAAHLLTTLIGMLTGSVKTATGLLYVFKYVEYFFVYYMVINNLESRQHAWRLVAAAFVTAAIVSVNGLAQIPGGRRVSAPFEGEAGEPNTFGGYLLVMIAVAAGLALESRGFRWRLALSGLIGLMFVPFLFTLSRTSYLAFIPMVLTLFAFFPRRRILLGVVLLAGVSAFALAPPEAVKERVRYTFKAHPAKVVEIGGVKFDPSTSDRLADSWYAIQAWTKSPIVGYGVTGHRFLDAQYPRTLAETGVVGMAAFVWLVWVLLRSVHRVWRGARDPAVRGLAGGFLAATVGILFHSIGSNAFIIIRIMEPFWLLAAIIVAMPGFESRTPAPAAPPRRAMATLRPA